MNHFNFFSLIVIIMATRVQKDVSPEGPLCQIYVRKWERLRCDVKVTLIWCNSTNGSSHVPLMIPQMIPQSSQLITSKMTIFDHAAVKWQQHPSLKVDQHHVFQGKVYTTQCPRYRTPVAPAFVLACVLLALVRFRRSFWCIQCVLKAISKRFSPTLLL